MNGNDPWKNYLHHSIGRPSHPVVAYAAQLNRSGLAQAVDAGCGVGNDVAPLLEQGYRVDAFDASPEAVRLCQERYAADPRVAVHQSHFETFDYPATGLVLAMSSLFFCEPDTFDLAWSRLTSAVQPGGVFVGHFMGPDDDWASGYHLPVCPLSKARVRSLFDDYELHRFDEQNGAGTTRLGADKHWHTFQVLATKL